MMKVPAVSAVSSSHCTRRRADAAAAVRGSDGEEIQVRDVVGVAHDGEAGERKPGARGEHDAVGMTHVPADARRAPRRRKAALHELM